VFTNVSISVRLIKSIKYIINKENLGNGGIQSGRIEDSEILEVDEKMIKHRRRRREIIASPSPASMGKI